MKYFFKILLTSLVLLPVSAFATTRDIYYGMKGNDVKSVQLFLRDIGIYKGPVTGGYYSLTKSAVVTFQKKYGVRSTGNVGKLTRTRMLQVYGEAVSKNKGTSVAKGKVSGIQPSSTSPDITNSLKIKYSTSSTSTTESQSDASGGSVLYYQPGSHITQPNFSIEGAPDTTQVSVSATPGNASTTDSSASTTDSVDSDQGIPAFDQSLEDRS